jgi:hypothetical protein
VTAKDDFGNDLGDVISQVTLTSNYAADVIDGSTITFGHASRHVITATLDGNTSSVTVTVIPAAAPTGTGLAFTGATAVPTLATGLGILILGLTLFSPQPTAAGPDALTRAGPLSCALGNLTEGRRDHFADPAPR